MTAKGPGSFRDTATPQLFLRNATGLVKGWSWFDAFVYSYMSVNFVTLGLYFSLSVLPFVATGQVIPALIISAIFVSFLVFSYAGLISVMPRAGGDYVWQSRLLTPGVGFVLAVTGWWFILWYWAPIYANILSIEVLQPIAAVLKSPAAIAWLASDTGVFVVCVAVTILAGALVALGMKEYARIQRMCFYIGGLGLLIMFVIMIFTSHGHFITAFNSAAHHLFGKQGSVYAQTLTVAAKGNSYIAPAHLGVSPFFGQSLLLIPILCFWILYPNWGATLYGEVRGAGDFRGVLRGMVAGLWVTFAIAIVFLFLVEKTFGWQFFNAANMNYWGAVYGSKAAPTIPVWSFPPLLVSFLIPTAALRAIFLLVFATWFIGWAGTLFLSSTRVVFAAAFDRILPEKTSYVSERRHVPVWGLILMLVPSLGRERSIRLHQRVQDIRARRGAGARGDVLRHADRRHDLAVAQARVVRKLGRRPVPDRRCPGHRGHIGARRDLRSMEHLPVAHQLHLRRQQPHVADLHGGDVRTGDRHLRDRETRAPPAGHRLEVGLRRDSRGITPPLRTRPGRLASDG